MHNSACLESTCQWISHVRETVSQKGQFMAHDDTGCPITVEWTMYNSASAEFNQAIRQISEILTQTYTRQEVEFARKYPEAVSDQMFLKSVAPLFEQGIGSVDWQSVEQQVHSTLHHFFATQDFAQWASSHDSTILVLAKDKSGNSVGAIQFSITPDYPYGTLRVGLTGVLSDFLNRGLEKLLMGSIFKIAPETTRLFLHTRATNEQALSLYQAWGFTPLIGSNADWPDFEYQTNNCDILQKIASAYNRLD